MVIENLRYLLYQYRPDTALYFGHRYADEYLPRGYMAGGGYVLSKKALIKFVEKLLPNHRETCDHEKKISAEDYALGETQ